MQRRTTPAQKWENRYKELKNDNLEKERKLRELEERIGNLEEFSKYCIKKIQEEVILDLEKININNEFSQEEINESREEKTELENKINEVWSHIKDADIWAVQNHWDNNQVDGLINGQTIEQILPEKEGINWREQIKNLVTSEEKKQKRNEFIAITTRELRNEAIQKVNGHWDSVSLEADKNVILGENWENKFNDLVSRVEIDSAKNNLINLVNVKIQQQQMRANTVVNNP